MGPRTRRRPLRSGWAGVAAITAVVAASWAPLVGSPFGDNHFGRVHGRYALQVRNLQEHGIVGSSFGADWSPYSTSPYAHHPPLAQLLGAFFDVLPGDGEWHARAGLYVLALLAIPAAAALLRGFGIRWGPTLLAVALMVGTGYFWIYAMHMFDIGAILALSAAVVQLRKRPAPPRWLVVAACVSALLAALGSWPGIAFATALGLWLVAARRLDRVTVAVAASVVAGTAASLAFMIGVHGLDVLASQAERRTSGGSFTAAEFVSRQARWLSNLLPVWYLVLAPFAALAGLADRRTRFYAVLSGVFAAGWVLVLAEGSYIHDYWGYLLLIPGLVGTGALLDWAARRTPARLAAPAGSLAGAALAAGFAVMVFGPTAQEYLYRPADAGRLVADNPPASGQQDAWHTGLAAPRWLAYYWDRHPRRITPERLAQEAGPADLIVVDLDRAPGWLPESATPSPVAQEGRYALFRAADLRDAVGQGG